MGTPRNLGLIAEKVAKVSSDLVVRDKTGDIYTVPYEAVNAMLLNEFLKEHRKNEELEKTIAELKSGMTAPAATVKEQAAHQRVSAQVVKTALSPQLGVRKCPYCRTIFTPNNHKQKFCSYHCRWDNRAKLRKGLNESLPAKRACSSGSTA